MKIGCLGSGTWGIALASLLAKKDYEVVLWGRNKDTIEHLQSKREHPKLKKFKIPENVVFTNDINEAVDNADMILESVTSSGIRSVFESIKHKNISCPIVISSKGIEQNTGLLFSEVLFDVLKNKDIIGCLSGPSHAEEVIKDLPTSVVCSAYNKDVMLFISKVFNSQNFRVYPNSDLKGVAFGGAIKNIIAIACGISDGLGYGDNAKAALMTRGLHEMRKLCVVKDANPETLNGLSGLGDLCVTCLSKFSRNYNLGTLIAKGFSLKEAEEEIKMVVEGAYSCVSAIQLAKKFNIAVPITEAVFAVLYENMKPKDIVKMLFQRAIKEEQK